ncbi:shikimate 5-dehydrogenase [Deinococcus peraridilitoris]|uniref:Shikimate 5-dehydrogenase n=1 Tax=Deinococcus peraridilitoris (strain DSM 19664 / LMG 22246 / CIP 109416 / KR-200) TaxID=937777 RepID=K9ZYA5_DEIPD|nr:shikimate 5-dehydrogenase [Deinococcus peraridilitoris]AFZ65735.1 shikimate 5-dehydrogenase [Deinococcus peraridilitoris DSM 19664]
MNPDAPLALIGYSPDTARALRTFGLLSLAVPEGPPGDVVGALKTLRFTGALIAPHLEEVMLAHAQPDAAARKAGRVDALSFSGALHATHTLEEAVVRLVEDSGYAARGAQVLIVGDGTWLRAALGVARLGAPSVTVASSSRPEAERVIALLPGGVKGYAVAAADGALAALAERADLVVVANGPLPAGVLQPYHTLLDLSGGALPLASRQGVATIDCTGLLAWRLSLQLEHATGQRFKPEALAEITATLSS